jgi:hypothetical protein
MVDLSLYLLDIVQNSIKAKATRIEVHLLIDSIQDHITMRIKDNGCGMSEEQLLQVRNPFYTTRTTRKVGLGIPFLQLACEQAQGSLMINSIQGSGTFLEATFQKSHIDCPPLGDIASSVFSIAIHQDMEEFIFTIQHQEQHMTFVLSDIVETVSPLSILEPFVMQYIQQYLKQTIIPIIGGTS